MWLSTFIASICVPGRTNSVSYVGETAGPRARLIVRPLWLAIAHSR